MQHQLRREILNTYSEMTEKITFTIEAENLSDAINDIKDELKAVKGVVELQMHQLKQLNQDMMNQMDYFQARGAVRKPHTEDFDWKL